MRFSILWAFAPLALVLAGLWIGCESNGYLRQQDYQADDPGGESQRPTRVSGKETGTLPSQPTVERPPWPSLPVDEPETSRREEATEPRESAEVGPQGNGGAQERMAIGANDEDAQQDQADRKEQFQKAMRLIESFEYDRARQILSGLVEPFGKAGQIERAAESLFWTAYCFEKTREVDDATTLYRRVVKDFPQTRSAGTARQRLEALTPQR
jgi:TolA-binding protein